MSNYDSSEAKLNEKLILINKIRRQYQLSNELFSELNSAVRYEYVKNVDGLSKVMEAVPLRLQTAISREIH